MAALKPPDNYQKEHTHRQTEAIALFCCVASAMWACYLVRREEALSCHGFSECI